MNKTIIININGIVFHIEEDAYDVLRSYMIDVKKHFGHSADSHEIVGDIENRIAEMFNERIVSGKKEVITMADVQEVIEQMGRVSEFGEEETTGRGTAYTSYHDDYASTAKKFMRDPDDRVFGGVCSGIGHYFNVESKWIRLAFLLMFLLFGTGLMLYLILWVVVPVAKTRADRMAMRGEAPNIRNFKRSFQEEMEGLRTNFTGTGGSDRTLLRSVGNFLSKAFIVLAKIIGIFFIIGACAGLIVLLVSIVATFGFLGTNNDIAMFPMTIIDPEIRSSLLISALIIAIIPLIALIGLIFRILFNRPVIGRYTGFTLLAVWLIALVFTTIYGVETASDFREESTVIEEIPLESSPVYYLDRNDITIIRLEDSLSAANRLDGIRRTAVGRQSAMFINQHRVYVQINTIDSLQTPSVTYEYRARGKSYEVAAERAGRINHRIKQSGEQIQIDSHFQVGTGEFMRDQRVNIRLNIPVGTKVYIKKELRRQLWDLPVEQCEQNYLAQDGIRPDMTAWIMTSSGLKCMVDPPVEISVEEEQIIQ